MNGAGYAAFSGNMRRLARLCGETWDYAEFWEVMSRFQELCGVLAKFAAFSAFLR